MSEMTTEKNKALHAFKFTIQFIIVMWAIHLVQVVFGFNLYKYGLLPRTSEGLIGLVTYPFLHGDFSHLISNTIPLFVLMFSTIYFYKNASTKVILLVYFGSGILVWAFARQHYHIGASGLIYGLTSFIFFSGILRRDVKSITLALLVVFLYGGIVWGVLPIKPGVSWEGHLFGAVAGLAAAIIFRKSDPPKKYSWEKEEEEDHNIYNIN